MGSTTGPEGEDQPLVEVVAANVRRARIDKGMTVAELAQRAGLAPGFVAGVESGELESTVVDLAALAIALDVQETVLLDRTMGLKGV